MIALPIEKITPRVMAGLMNMISRLTGSALVAEDIIADAVAKAMSVAWQIRPKTFVSWLYTVSRNLATDHWRIQDKHRKWANARGPQYFSRSPMQGLIETEAVAEFKRLTRKLTKMERQFVTMRTAKGLSYKEIAEKTGRTPLSIRAMAHRIRQKLSPWREKVIGS